MVLAGEGAHGRRSNDSAVAPVLAMVVLLLVSAASAAAVYDWTTRFQGGGEAPASISFVTTGTSCRTRVLVAATIDPVPLSELRIETSDAEEYLVALGDRAAVDEPWSGVGLGGTLSGGDEFEVWTAEEGVEFRVVHVPSNSAIGRFPAILAAADESAPTATTTESSTQQITGTARDPDCSGVTQVGVLVTDATTGLSWDGAGWAAQPAELIATLDEPGAIATTWTVDVASIPWEDGHTYTASVVTEDAAGHASSSEPDIVAPAEPEEGDGDANDSGADDDDADDADAGDDHAGDGNDLSDDCFDDASEDESEDSDDEPDDSDDDSEDSDDESDEDESDESDDDSDDSEDADDGSDDSDGSSCASEEGDEADSEEEEAVSDSSDSDEDDSDENEDCEDDAPEDDCSEGGECDGEDGFDGDLDEDDTIGDDCDDLVYVGDGEDGEDDPDADGDDDESAG